MNSNVLAQYAAKGATPDNMIISTVYRATLTRVILMPPTHRLILCNYISQEAL